MCFSFMPVNSLKAIPEIDRIFEHPACTGYPKSALVKYKPRLREEFGCARPCDPDISCNVTEGKLPLKYIKRVVVDPYIISGKPLRNWVAEICPSKADHLIQERVSRRKHLYNELARFIIKNVSILELSQNSYVSEDLSKWAQEIIEKRLEYQFARFASYLRNGTLLKNPRLK